MIETRAQQLIDRNEPSAELTLIVRWPAKADLAAARSVKTRQDRAAAARDAYRAVKKDLLQRPTDQGDVKVVDLPGTSQAIVSAASATWRKLAPTLQGLSEVQISPNGTIGIITAD